MQMAQVQWVLTLDNQIQHGSLTNIPPAEVEATFYATLEIEPMSA